MGWGLGDIMESYRAMLDLKDAGIETQLVIANLMLPEEGLHERLFPEQERYADEISEGN